MSTTEKETEGSTNLFHIDILDMEGRDRDRWVLRSYNLADYLGTVHHEEFRDNVAAEAVIKKWLFTGGPHLLSRITFDSEMGCFFAYAQSYRDALLLVGNIYTIVASRIEQEGDSQHGA